MTLDTFKKIDVRFRNEKPALFRLSRPDPAASDEQLLAVESEIGVTLPEKYREFLKEFGGGDFGLITVFSADPLSMWRLPKQLDVAKGHVPVGFIPISEDGCGGYYGLYLRNGRSNDEIYYWHFDSSLEATGFNDILEFLARHAYEPS